MRAQNSHAAQQGGMGGLPPHLAGCPSRSTSSQIVSSHPVGLRCTRGQGGGCVPVERMRRDCAGTPVYCAQTVIG